MDIIVDIDGTIADMRHRRHHVSGSKKDWDAFHAELHLDKPIQPIVDIIINLERHHSIIICTCRPVDYRDQTIKWFDDNDILYSVLFMRPSGDYRKAEIVKEEMLRVMRGQGLNPELVFEDKQECVDMWRRNGIVCLQNSMKELP